MTYCATTFYFQTDRSAFHADQNISHSKFLISIYLPRQQMCSRVKLHPYRVCLSKLCCV